MRRGVIALPPMGEKPTDGRPSTFYIFGGDEGRRDSYVGVAQLCPEFTARLVDRWQELEQQVARPQLPQTMAEVLRLAADKAEQIEQQQRRLEHAKPSSSPPRTLPTPWVPRRSLSVTSPIPQPAQHNTCRQPPGPSASVGKALPDALTSLMRVVEPDEIERRMKAIEEAANGTH
ncbi:hypothetical protein [Halomonas sp. LBP4]|uniref:hypothetical protein n=1 Tax=Halomonas sp. LBP4 TaxID=2044917 RepID=UPI001C646F09|nr:hypothetical protein [Halomonas sp. LBP4]